MPKKKESTMVQPQTLEYDNNENDAYDIENDISDDEYEMENVNSMKQNQPSFTQILIVCRLLGTREFILSRNGNKKFYQKVRQYQELSEYENTTDVNYGARMGKSAEILCKLAGITQILKIAIEILQ